MALKPFVDRLGYYNLYPLVKVSDFWKFLSTQMNDIILVVL